MPRATYECAGCQTHFEIDLTDAEARASLRTGRPDRCPRCGLAVGRGPVRCRSCGQAQEAVLPHWHVSCDLHDVTCSRCGARIVSLCIC